MVEKGEPLKKGRKEGGREGGEEGAYRSAKTTKGWRTVTMTSVWIAVAVMGRRAERNCLRKGRRWRGRKG